MKKFIALLLCGILTATALTGCGSSSAGGENGEVIVYNWGEYIDPDTITMFEKETGIKVVYDEFETNEIMYPKVEAGSSAYDVVCPSDYMVQKMIENDLIQELDYDKIPNAKENIGAEYYEQAAAYDPGNKYCVPYCWGTVVKIDKSVINAAYDLGANGVQTFVRIIFPLSLPGMFSGITMVFVPALTTFVISKILGGSKILLIGNVIEQEFTQTGNWNLGSGLSIVLMLFIIFNMVISVITDKEGEANTL